MFYYTHKISDEEYLITRYSVEHDLDNNSYDVFLFANEDNAEVQIEHEEFIKYEEVEKYLNDLWNNKFSKFIQDTVDAYEKII